MDLGSTLLAALSSGLVAAAVVLGILRLGAAWDWLALRQVAALQQRCQRLAMDTSRLADWMRYWGMLLVAIPVACWFAWYNVAVGAVLTFLWYRIPRHVLDWLIQRRSRLLRDQIVTVAGGLANTTRAGLTLHQGLQEVLRDAPEPLAGELRRITADYRRGRPLKDALEAVRQRLQLEPFTLFATAIQVCLERGGRVNEALDRISASLRDNQRLERKMEADTASGRYAVLILAAFPFLFLGMMYMLDGQAVQLLFMRLAGQIVMACVLLLVYAGSRWALRIMELQY